MLKHKKSSFFAIIISLVAILSVLILFTISPRTEQTQKDIAQSEEVSTNDLNELYGSYELPEEYEGITKIIFDQNNVVTYQQYGYYKLRTDHGNHMIDMCMNDNNEDAVSYLVIQQNGGYELSMDLGEETSTICLKHISGEDGLFTWKNPFFGEYSDMDHENCRYIFEENGMYYADMQWNYTVDGEKLRIGNTEYTYSFNKNNNRLFLHTENGDITFVKK